MLTKPELITRLVAHDHTAWSQEQTPVLQALEERMLEQMLAEADRRSDEAPLNLNVLKKFSREALAAQEQKFDAKLANFAQQAEERAEREQIVGYLVAHRAGTRKRPCLAAHGAAAACTMDWTRSRTWAMGCRASVRMRSTTICRTTIPKYD